MKTGRFGRFLACPGYPECSFTKPLVVEMPGKCPKCGSRLLKRTSKKGYPYYACEHLSRTCDFLTWDVPVKDNCPACGKTMFKKSGRGFKRPFCINEECANFVPEEKRGGYPRRTGAADKSADGKKTASAGKTAGRKAGTAGRTKKSSDGSDG